MRIALLGHGTNTIPPKGWGAVESLIWEYSESLKALGHDVHIINTMDNDYIIDYLNRHLWDAIHMHDDSLINLVPDLKHMGLIVVTSHYPAIHDRSVWNDKSTDYNFEEVVIQPLLHYMKQTDRIIIGALCLKDKNAFLAMGIPSSRIFLMVNGASAKDIVCDDRPTNGLSICLGQICDRKRQYLLTDIKSVVFWGPCLNTTFKQNPAYLGEMDGDVRNKSLTEYENLVLLSTAESSPLVLKEALFAGLGLVLSEAVATELPTHWPWITVIPESHMNDKEFIVNALAANRRVAKSHKRTIRQTAIALWDWPVLIQAYEAHLSEQIAHSLRRE